MGNVCRQLVFLGAIFIMNNGFETSAHKHTYASGKKTVS